MSLLGTSAVAGVALVFPVHVDGLVPGLGVAGAGAALILFNIAAATWRAMSMRSDRSGNDDRGRRRRYAG